MSRRFKFRDIPSDSGEDAATASYVIDRRGFLKSLFNAAAGLVTLAAGGVAFAATLMGTSEVDGGDSAVRFWVPTGAEDSVWYGTQHLEPMSYSSFVNAAAQSPTGISGAQGVWSGMPVNVVYVPHEENKNSLQRKASPVSSSWTATRQRGSTSHRPMRWKRTSHTRRFLSTTT